MSSLPHWKGGKNTSYSSSLTSNLAKSFKKGQGSVGVRKVFPFKQAEICAEGCEGGNP